MKHLKRFNESVEDELVSTLNDMVLPIKDKDDWVVSVSSRRSQNIYGFHRDDSIIRITIYPSGQMVSYIDFKKFDSDMVETIDNLIDFIVDEGWNYYIEFDSFHSEVERLDSTQDIYVLNFYSNDEINIVFKKCVK